MTTSAPVTQTTTAPEPVFTYFVIAEESAARLAVLGPVDGFIDCLAIPFDRCAAFEVAHTVDLPARPHNLAAVGAVVFASHPAAGLISRVDLEAGEVSTVGVGVEPHDLEVDSDGLLWVTDEDGRTVLVLDPATLEVERSMALAFRPHDLAFSDRGRWVTMIGSGDLALVIGETVEFFATGASPHDVAVDKDGKVWFSNWSSHALMVFDPAFGETTTAPADVVEPHHFALDAEGNVWITDNGGQSVLSSQFPGSAVEVGPTPHHISFAGPLAGVAASGSGEAVSVAEGRVVHSIALSTGLHGVAAVELTTPLTPA